MNHKLCVRGAILSLALLLTLFIPFSAFAQQIQLTGSVIDSTGEPIIGASVIEKGTTNGLITDFDGNFSLSVHPQATIVVSYVGYKSEEIALNGRKNIQITLKEDALMLEETVVIGYGTMKKSDMTGAISSVNVDDLASRTTTNPAEALQGKVAGVNILKSGGYAGAGVQIKIRGVKSFGSNEPLYVIDGFPGDITSVNPQDIASMEVLKDGAAAAIYGSVAANGVIIITTKNGKKGETKVDFSSYLSMTKVSRKLKVLNSDEYVSVHKQMYDNYNQYATAEQQIAYPQYITAQSDVDSDWQDAVLRTGFAQNYMFSIRGGGEAARYSVSYNHSDDKGIFIGNDYRQDNARIKLNMTKGIFDFDANMGFKYTLSHMPQYSLKEMYMISPLVPIYDENEESGYGLTNFNNIPNNRNVIADNHYISSDSKNYATNANISMTVNLTSWLNFRTSYSYRGVHRRGTYHRPPYTSDAKLPSKYAYYRENSSYWEEQVCDNILTFNKSFGQHSLNAMAGSSVTAQKYTWNRIITEGKKVVYEVKDGQLITSEMPAGFLDPSFNTIAGGAGGTLDGDGSRHEYNRASFFGRVNYAYAGKYMVQATVRRDGSSKFGSNNRWGNFPSVALGWRISEEDFFPKDIALTNLKLRASWGRLGNEGALGYYDFQSLIDTDNGMWRGYVQGSGSNPWPGSIAPNLSNDNLKWETTDTKNIGFDFGFFNNKLYGALNYYKNETKDLLITKVLPPSSGLYSPVMNVGKIRNTGFELELNWADSKRDFDYNVGFNLATTKNKVLALADEGQALSGEGVSYGTSHFVTRTQVGKPIASYYLYQTDGIFQSMKEVEAHVNDKGELLQPKAKPGDIRFKDLNKDGRIDEEDKAHSGSGIPKFEANLSLGAAYKGFDLSLLFSSAWDFKLYNANRFFYEGMGSGTNLFKGTLNAWTEENTKTNMPRAVLGDPNGNTRESDRFLEKGDFIRLRQAQVGYSIPKHLARTMQIEKLRFFISGENLFTITDYKGVDPEFSRTGSHESNPSILNTGIDNLSYPFTRSYSVGVQLTF